MTASLTRRPARPWLAPAVAGAAGLAGLAYVGLRNPAEGRAFVPCPLHAATGLWCPGCGTTRGLHKLVNGDVLGALGSNLFLPLTIGLAAYLWLAWLLPALGSRPVPSLRRLPPATWVVLIVALVAFGVVRNLPVAPLDALAP